LVLIEFAKQRFYAKQPHTVRTPLTVEQRHEHRVRRRIYRFVTHSGPRAVRRTTESGSRR
jgi:hypothetical protein